MGDAQWDRRIAREERPPDASMHVYRPSLAEGSALFLAVADEDGA